MFVIQAPDQLRAHWQRFTEMLRKQFPPRRARDRGRNRRRAGVPALPPGALAQDLEHQPARAAQQGDQTAHQCDRGIFPNDATITRLVGSQLLEQQEEWQLERRRFFSEATIAKIPELEEAQQLTDSERAEGVAGSIN